MRDLNSKLSGIFALLTLLSASPLSAEKADWDELREQFSQSLMDWQVPGMALTIVRDGEVEIAEGFGVRQLGKSFPVTEHTVFSLGAVTQTFTAASLGTLVDEGRLQWNDRVVKYIAALRLYDPYVSEEVTLTDLLAHRTGLAAVPVLWKGGGHKRGSLMYRMRFVKPVTGFRYGYNPQPLGILAAGQVVQAISGKPWDDYVRDRLFRPLRMRETYTKYPDVDLIAEVAHPHVWNGQRVVSVESTVSKDMAPAEGIHSSAGDLAKWLQLLLSPGTYGDRVLISPSTMVEMYTPQVSMSPDAGTLLGDKKGNFFAHGLGWKMRDYRGTKLLWQSGDTDGMSAALILLPEHNTGIAVMANRDAKEFVEHVFLTCVDKVLGVEETQDWSQLGMELQEQEQSLWQTRVEKFVAERQEGKEAGIAEREFVGVFRNELYGDVELERKHGSLRFSYGDGWRGRLEPWHFTTFIVNWDQPVMKLLYPTSVVTFTLGKNGKVSSLEWGSVGEFKRMNTRGKI